MNTRLSTLQTGLVTTVVWLALGFVPATAQNFDVGMDFLVGLPQNEFRDNVDEKGYGFDGHFGYFLGDTPIMIGANVGYLNYGTEEWREAFDVTFPEFDLRVRTTNNILLLHGFARVQPQDGVVRPYAEGLWGFKYLFTRTSIRDQYYDEAIASETNFDDLTGSWGAGAGVDIRLWEPRQRGEIYDISLNLSATYLWGGEAEYLQKGSIQRDPETGVTYLVSRSKTDMLLPRVGIRVRF